MFFFEMIFIIGENLLYEINSLRNEKIDTFFPFLFAFKRNEYTKTFFWKNAYYTLEFY